MHRAAILFVWALLLPVGHVEAKPIRFLADMDQDGVLDHFDNAPLISNGAQMDADGDGWGDVVDRDIDNDGVPNYRDNAPGVFNPRQIDRDHDGWGAVIDDNDSLHYRHSPYFRPHTAFNQPWPIWATDHPWKLYRTVGY